MRLAVVCPPCGKVLSAASEDELVRLTADHAKQKHGVDVTREEVLARAHSDQAIQGMHHVPPGAGPCFGYGGQLMHVKVGAERSGGELTMIENEVAPGAGPPLHVHARESEAYYVLEGEFEFTCGERTVRGGVGTFVHAPRAIPHRFQNVGETTGRLLFAFTPAGIEKMFAELSAEPALDRARMAAIIEKFGLTFVV